MQIAPATLERPTPGDVVRAAGGVVIRRGRRGVWEVALVHRPARQDWTLPKGKLEPGESSEDAAVREVHEETGLTCRLGRFVGHTEYRDRKDRPKVVAYWFMEPVGGTFAPNDEVDVVRWLPYPKAVGLLTYERDRELLAAAFADDELAAGA